MHGFVKHRATEKFWEFYKKLPVEIQKLADENFALLKQDPRHRSLHFKKVGRFLSARVGIHHRTIGVEDGEDLIWFWIGRHDEYEFLLRNR